MSLFIAAGFRREEAGTGRTSTAIQPGIVTIQVPAAGRLATVGRLPQAGCPAGLVNPCRGSPGWSGSAATGWTPRPAARAGRRTGAEHSEGVLAILAGGGQVCCRRAVSYTHL